jgi:nucleoside phosphorylase
MKQPIKTLFSALAILLLLSCGSSQVVTQPGGSKSIHGQPDNSKSSGPLASDANGARASFEDRTREIIGHAERLIEKNQKEGAVLDQRWYGLKYFGKHQELIFNARKIKFFGGLENDVRKQVGGQYTSIVPVEANQDSGDIRMYIGKRKEGNYDFIVIGQNGKEVALKTIIRLIYLATFADGQTKKKYRVKLESFKKSFEVSMSSVSARQEYIGFLNKHGIANPEAVMIGFRGDIRSLLKDEGISDPESYTDESLRVNWYPNANGKKVLLVSIDKNRIYASRSGALIEALFAISANTPPSIILLGSGGAVEASQLVGEIVTPTSVMNGDSFPASGDKGVLVHIIRNKAADESTTKTADVSVESVVVETTTWVTQMKDRRIDTVDQELFYIMDAINSSAYAGKVEVFIGTLVTDNVSSNAQNTAMTLQHAEDVIAQTADIRREFLSKVMKKIGILRNKTSGLPRRYRSPENRSVSVPGR